MELIHKFFQRRAIKSYVKRLPRALAKDYGKHRTYTPKQVVRCIERYGLSVSYSCYGIAIFSNKKEFDRYHTDMGEVCDYQIMRSEIGASFFQGNIDFGISDIHSVSSSMGGGGDTADFSGGDSGSGSD